MVVYKTLLGYPHKRDSAIYIYMYMYHKFLSKGGLLIKKVRGYSGISGAVKKYRDPVGDEAVS